MVDVYAHRAEPQAAPTTHTHETPLVLIGEIGKLVQDALAVSGWLCGARVMSRGMKSKAGEGAAIPRAASSAAKTVPFIVDVEAGTTGTNIGTYAASEASLAEALP